jgi:hypothetical protein
MTSSKAIAAGIGGNLTVIAIWAMTLIPGWATIPDEPRMAIQALIVTLLSAGVVYFAPANALKVAQTIGQ